jgi:dephospho-CoA kinase
MITLGVTGGIGMGKSAAASLLEQHGVKVIDTDQLAREVVEPGTPGLTETVALVGREVLDATGRLNRKEVARRVFADAQLREKLEAILHPRIRERWQSQLEQWRGQGTDRAAVIIPLLFETNAASSFDAVICIASSPKTQQARLQSRGWTAEQIQQRIAAQFPVQKKMDLANYVVWNEGSLEVLGAQLDKILHAVG